MRKLDVIAAGCAATLMAIGGAVAAMATDATALVEKQRHAVPAPLRPLTDADQQSTRESGCQLSFNDSRSRTLVYAIGHAFMVRTRAGLQVCPITDRQFSALSGGGTRSCGGMRITVRQTGRVTGHQASDSASGRARLTVTGGGRIWSTNGYWGTAC